MFNYLYHLGCQILQLHHRKLWKKHSALMELILFQQIYLRLCQSLDLVTQWSNISYWRIRVMQGRTGFLHLFSIQNKYCQHFQFEWPKLLQ
ncbi:hypothetical protein FGO68_gene2968 [Halteria grandinella]|uniref:Uncharacterized protein n=1 Tax=Halteria grandinella TaxID=5974 RepID=A0A8J8NUL7_HALGN|nr:hypothetical protein FGO68_gene2968 [Halteria grandinella]